MSLFLELSTKNFSEASKINGNSEFKFIIGDKHILCHKFVAAFLSKMITRELISDPTTNSVKIEPYAESILMNDSHINEEEERKSIEAYQYNILCQLIEGHNIEITKDDFSFIKDLDDLKEIDQLHKFVKTKIYSILQLSSSLENEELKSQIYNHLLEFVFPNKKKSSSKETTKEEIKDELKKLKSIENIMKIFGIFDNKNKEFHQKEDVSEFVEKYFSESYELFIEKISLHFYELENETIFLMNRTMLDDVLRSKSLRVETEDKLLDTLIKYRNNLRQKRQHEEIDDENFFLLELVKLEYLGETGIKRFLAELTLESLNEPLWTNIKKRLMLPVKDDSLSNPRFIENKFIFDINKPFNGILQHLIDKTGGNICKNNTIEITCSNFCCGNLESLVEFNNPDAFAHVDGNPSPRWLQYNFKTRKVKIDSYLISSSTKNNHYLRSWKIEISNGDGWTPIDERSEVSELNGSSKMKLFKVDKNHEPFQFIRIITDKDNWTNHDGFDFAHFELFGKLFE